jgi:hypothetical protein
MKVLIPGVSSGETTSGQPFVSSTDRSDLGMALKVLEAIGHGAHTRSALASVADLPASKIDEALGLFVALDLVYEEPLTGEYEITEKGLGSSASTSSKAGRFEMSVEPDQAAQRASLNEGASPGDDDESDDLWRHPSVILRIPKNLKLNTRELSVISGLSLKETQEVICCLWEQKLIDSTSDGFLSFFYRYPIK